MTFDLHKILASKRALRRNLAARPIGEKLRLLDALREREIAIRGRVVPPRPVAGTLYEPPTTYRANPR